jgi:hypothetical protein
MYLVLGLRVAYPLFLLRYSSCMCMRFLGDLQSVFLFGPSTVIRSFPILETRPSVNCRNFGFKIRTLSPIVNRCTVCGTGTGLLGTLVDGWERG